MVGLRDRREKQHLTIPVPAIPLILVPLTPYFYFSHFRHVWAVGFLIFGMHAS
jgi:hypothetical protein